MHARKSGVGRGRTRIGLRLAAMNQDYLTTSPSLWLTTPAALLAIVLSLVYTNVAARVLCGLPGPTAARLARQESLAG